MIPMLPRTFNPRYNHYPCYLQPKLKGVRALYQCGVFQASDEKLWRPKVLEHLIDAFSPYRNSLGNVIFDGVLYVHGWEDERISTAATVSLKDPTTDTLELQYHIFDVVDAERNYSDRWLEVYPCIQFWNHSHIRVVSTVRIWFPEEAANQLTYWTGLGYDGIILRPDGPYEFGEKKCKDRMVQYRSSFLWERGPQLNQAV